MKLRIPISGEPHKARAEFPLGNFTLPHGEISLSTQPAFARRVFFRLRDDCPSGSAHCIRQASARFVLNQTSDGELACSF